MLAAGPDASSCPDNGRVYTARFGGGRNAFEYLLPLLGVQQKNGSPAHPQTQGKVCVSGWLDRPLGRRGSPRPAV
jgi:hypothetical protein